MQERSLADYLATSAEEELKTLKADATRKEDTRETRPTDPRLFKLVLSEGKKGTNTVNLRFLPSKIGKSAYPVRYFHTLDGAAGKRGFYSLCRNYTFHGGRNNDSCFACKTRWEHFNDLKDRNVQAPGKDPLFRDLREREERIANVYIVSDQNNPDNNGKVLILKFKQQIWDKIRQKFDINEAGLKAGKKEIIPHDLVSGANFLMEADTGDGHMPQYKNSEFLPPSRFAPDTDEGRKFLENVWNAMHDIESFVSEEAFTRSYDDDEKNYNAHFGIESKPKGYAIPPDEVPPGKNTEIPRPWNGPKPEDLAAKSKPAAAEPSSDTPNPKPPAQIPASSPTPPDPNDVDSFFKPKA